MKRVLLTGATGYVGGRSSPRFSSAGTSVRALSRDPARATLPTASRSSPATSSSGTGLEEALDGIDVALYLVHSMGAGAGPFADADRRGGARRSRGPPARAGVGRVIYLGGLRESRSICAAARRSPTCCASTGRRSCTPVRQW